MQPCPFTNGRNLRAKEMSDSSKSSRSLPAELGHRRGLLDAKVKAFSVMLPALPT